ncbi:hypothetical protein AOG2_12700 [Geobacter sp. AOG2]|nr:hypothetical protein AOG2_12700 [Geobacter sp. AOG2]
MSTAPEAAPVAVAAMPETVNVAPGPAVVTLAAAGPVSSPSGHGNGGSGAGEGLDLAGTGSGARGESIESLREGYIRKNYGYIRDLINSNLRYPGKARRLGWSGALKVEFLVLEDGSVQAIRVAKSSGVPLLDRNAEDTVRRSAPFPRPPVSARLVIPVEYVLE